MTKQFLLYLNVRAVLVEQSRIRVPKCMPTESPNSDLFSRAQQPATLMRSKGARAFQYVYLRIPTRFLEERKGAFADILAKVSLGRDQPA